MEEEINIDEVLFPNSWELQEDEDGLLTAEIVDEEIDNFKCSFNNDGCVEINTEGYEYITLSTEALLRLVMLVEDAEEIYTQKNNEL